MRIRATALVCLFLSFGTPMVVGGSIAHASCAWPGVDVSPGRGPQGSKITITGDYYWDRCNDVISCHVFTPTPSPVPSGSPTPTPSPTSTCETPDPPLPLRDIRLEFHQNGRVWKLGTVDANSAGAIRFIAEVPDDADYGAAEIRACIDEPRCTYPRVAFRVGTLADTGAGSFWPIAAGALLLLGGLALGLTRRGRAA